MIAVLGTVAVLVALAGAIWLAVAGLSAVSGRTVPSLRTPAGLLFGGSVAGMGLLEVGLLTDDFSIAYIANHSSTSTPLLFKFASAWGALEGSILLWGLVLGLLAWLLQRRVGEGDRLGTVALGVIGVVSVFFFGMMASVANPFEVCTSAGTVGCLESSAWPFAGSAAPGEGRGPNPLLQNHILMAIHPPMLYLGYVGLTAPFAFAISALLLAQPGAAWAARTRRWTLAAWAFLTVGILLGGWWSYEVLGWGGYWGWDPVENASFLPWLTATAFLHSVVVQLRRGVLQSWNFVLVIATFALTIFGTFLTRSGSITSVHSFTQSAVGPLLLGFFVLVVVAGLGLFASRAHLMAERPRVESFASREGAILLNNLLMTVWTATVLVGTVYPILVEALTGSTIGIGAGFFEATSGPIALVLLLAIGVGQVTPWKASNRDVMIERLLVPALIAVAAGALAAILGLRDRAALVVLVLAVFAATPPIVLLVRQAAARPESLGSGMRLLVMNDRGYWGGMLSHLGVAVLALGIAGSAGMAIHADDITLPIDEPVPVAGHVIEYQSGFTDTDDQRRVVGANIEVTRSSATVGTARPALQDYGTQVIATPGVLTGPVRDVFIVLRSIDSAQVVVDVSVFPLQWMVWVGGFLVAAGGAWSFTARRSRREVAA